MEWTEETIFRLRSLWQEGHSTAEIGRRMSITKNAVVGKAHRLTLPARPSPIRKTPAGADGRPPQVVRPARGLPSGESRVAQFVPRSTSASVEDAEASQAGIDASVGGSVTPLRAPPTTAVPPHSATEPRVRANEVSDDPEPETTRVRREPHVASVSRVAGQPVPRRYGQSCCWPLGDPGTKQFHFCGGEPIPGKPYCVEHAQLAYVKLRDRRETVA